MRPPILIQPAAISLRQLLPHASFIGCSDLRTHQVTLRSQDCTPRSIFAVIAGTQTDGQQWVADALSRGASGLLVSFPLPDVPVPQCVVRDVRAACTRAISALAGDPAHHLRAVGVTGTNGKTTVTWMVRHLLRSARRSCGLLGTIEYDDGETIAPSSLTTPDPATLMAWLSRMVTRRTETVAMELSSHALDQSRAATIGLDVAILTNITQDHFDYHGSYDRYRVAKARLFDQLRPHGLALLCHDDPGSLSVLASARRFHRALSYGTSPGADMHIDIQREDRAGSRFTVREDQFRLELTLPLPGRHNVLNATAAVMAGRHLGLTEAQLSEGLAGLPAVPGRLEPVDVGQPFDVFVDYAHTDDALRRSLQTVRGLTSGRVLCVFGAGGDRDRAKRPLLGLAASAADVAIVTSDNPRSESPRAIIDEIVEGFPTGTVPLVEEQREQAIALAIELARPGDVVLIAGKGHEREQIIGTQRLPFDDVEVARRALLKPRTATSGPHLYRPEPLQGPERMPRGLARLPLWSEVG